MYGLSPVSVTFCVVPSTTDLMVGTFDPEVLQYTVYAVMLSKIGAFQDIKSSVGLSEIVETITSVGAGMVEMKQIERKTLPRAFHSHE